MPDAAPSARGDCKPRRPQASPLFWFVSDHLHRLQAVYDERFAGEIPAGIRVAGLLIVTLGLFVIQHTSVRASRSI